MTMFPALKRELLFWLIVAGVMAGYIALGTRLARHVPPEPDMKPGRVWSMDSLRDHFAAVRQRRDAQQRHNDFLRIWYCWGTAVGVGLILIYSWKHPPWSARVNDAPPRDRTAKPGPRVLPVSRSAMLRMAATLLVVIVALVLIAALSL